MPRALEFLSDLCRSPSSGFRYRVSRWAAGISACHPNELALHDLAVGCSRIPYLPVDEERRPRILHCPS